MKKIFVSGIILFAIFIYGCKDSQKQESQEEKKGKKDNYSLTIISSEGFNPNVYLFKDKINNKDYFIVTYHQSVCVQARREE